MYSKIGFNLPHSALIRIWHWSLFVLMAFSLFSVLIGNTLLKTKNTVGIVKNSLKENGITVSEDQAKAVSHEFKDLIWNWHKLFGYGLGILLIVRFLIEFSQSQNEKILKRMKTAKLTIPLKEETEDKKDLQHFLWANRAYLLFFVLLAIMAITGLAMAYEDDVAFLDHIKELNHTIHGYGQYFMYTYLILHIGGVVIADLGKHKGIVSGMIHGNET